MTETNSYSYDLNTYPHRIIECGSDHTTTLYAQKDEEIDNKILSMKKSFFENYENDIKIILVATQNGKERSYKFVSGNTTSDVENILKSKLLDPNPSDPKTILRNIQEELMKDKIERYNKKGN